MVLSNSKVDIPPDAPNHLVTASKTIADDVAVFGVFPHMHLIGRTVHVTARLPDGTSRPIIDIDDWNFNWQYYYQFSTPLRLPAGTRLEGRWTYDNSSGNPANPSRPPRRVTYGEQTTNEMAILTLDLMPVERSDKPAGDR
jgi:hypothetical protein